MSIFSVLSNSDLPGDVRDFLNSSRGREVANDFERRADSYGSEEHQAMQDAKTYGRKQAAIDCVTRFVRARM